MPKEEKTSQEEKPVTEKVVTDGDLDAAWKETFVEGEKAEEIKKEEDKGKPSEEIEEPIDQGERSKMGRRVKRMEDMLTQVISKLDSFNYPVDRETRKNVGNVEENPDDLPEVISTPQDVERVLSIRERKRLEDQQKYERGYVSTLGKLGSANSEIHEEVLDLMEKEWKIFGRRRSDNPELDAELNYSKAEGAILKRKMASPRPKPNVKGEKSTVSTNLSVSSSEESSSSTGLPPLDEFAADFVKKTGMKEESVREALKGEIPINLTRTK